MGNDRCNVQNRPLVTIYTDGASKGNPGPGGWGIYMTCQGREKELFGGEELTSNNRMELKAAILALKSLKTPCSVVLFSDSKYVIDGITKWLGNWIKNNWKTASNKPVKNQDLWMSLHAEVERHYIDWHWVKGHNSDLGNERADFLANKGCQINQ